MELIDYLRVDTQHTESSDSAHRCHTTFVNSEGSTHTCTSCASSIYMANPRAKWRYRSTMAGIFGPFEIFSKSSHTSLPFRVQTPLLSIDGHSIRYHCTLRDTLRRLSHHGCTAAARCHRHRCTIDSPPICGTRVSMGFLWAILNGVPLKFYIELFYGISMGDFEWVPIEFYIDLFYGISMGKIEWVPIEILY
jgi:hypothetical protein